MDRASPNTLSCCCFVVVLAIIGWVLLVNPTYRKSIVRLFRHGTTGGRLPPRLAQLSAAALPGVQGSVVGMSAEDLQPACELVASMLLARELLWPEYSDRAIGDGMRENRRAVLDDFQNGLAQIQPRTPDVNRAIATIVVLQRPGLELMVNIAGAYFINRAARQQPPFTAP